MKNCLICERQKSEKNVVIHESDHFMVVHFPCSPQTPLMYKGHLFIETKRHITSLADFNKEESLEYGVLIQKAARALRIELNAEHIYSYTISHLAPHVHLHVVPRYPNTPEQYWDRLLHDWPNAPRVSDREIIELSSKLARTFN